MHAHAYWAKNGSAKAGFARLSLTSLARPAGQPQAVPCAPPVSASALPESRPSFYQAHCPAARFDCSRLRPVLASAVALADVLSLSCGRARRPRPNLTPSHASSSGRRRPWPATCNPVWLDSVPDAAVTVFVLLRPAAFALGETVFWPFRHVAQRGLRGGRICRAHVLAARLCATLLPRHDRPGVLTVHACHDPRRPPQQRLYLLLAIATAIGSPFVCHLPAMVRVSQSLP